MVGSWDDVVKVPNDELSCDVCFVLYSKFDITVAYIDV